MTPTQLTVLTRASAFFNLVDFFVKILIQKWFEKYRAFVLPTQSSFKTILPCNFCAMASIREALPTASLDQEGNWCESFGDTDLQVKN
jgi:hypothetical protein